MSWYPPVPDDDLLTPQEVARLFGVNPKTVLRWAHQKRLPAVMTLGGRRRYPRAAVVRLLRELRGDRP